MRLRTIFISPTCKRFRSQGYSFRLSSAPRSDRGRHAEAKLRMIPTTTPKVLIQIPCGTRLAVPETVIPALTIVCDGPCQLTERPPFGSQSRADRDGK